MNVARVALLGVAVLAAGGAAFLVRSMTHKQEPKSRPVAIETPTAQVLVASHAIEPGTILSAADLRWQKWPQDAVSESYLTQKGHAQRDRRSDRRHRARACRSRRAAHARKVRKGEERELHGGDAVAGHACRQCEDFGGIGRRRLHLAGRRRGRGCRAQSR